jgi:two-component system phosphate regulon sensor histidine kinase PhoR
LRIGVRLRHFLISLFFIAISVGAADAYLTHAQAARVTAMISDALFARARLVARDASASNADLDDLMPWEALATGAGEASGVRVTIIRHDGVVVGDSEVPLERIRSLENHGQRPEVSDALGGGRGEATRMSTTVNLRMMYVAVPFERGGSIAGAARVAEPMSAVDQAVAEARRFVFVASLIAVAIALLMSQLAGGRLATVATELTIAARRMKAGDLAVRTHVSGNDELAELAHALDSLAQSLAETLDELRSERDVLGRILEGMHEGVLVLDKEGRVVMMNAALRSMVLMSGDVSGKLAIEIVRDASLHEMLRRAGSTREVTEGEIDLPGLKARRLLVRTTPLAGEDEGVLAVLVDVTELRRLESMRRDFVANVSHELRTPVAAVRSAAETLMNGAIDDPDAAMRFVDIIDRNAGRLQNLIEDLLELSRIEAKELHLRHEKVDLATTTSNVLALHREKAEKKRIRLSSDIPATARDLETDPRALEQVISNLVDNAVKYCPQGAGVAVSAEQTDGGIKLHVADTGPGIDKAHLPRIFERFYRVDAGRSREIGGTGLGLSIVKHLVEAMGGSVSVKSELGKGATFTVCLPRAPA